MTPKNLGATLSNTFAVVEVNTRFGSLGGVAVVAAIQAKGQHKARSTRGYSYLTTVNVMDWTIIAAIVASLGGREFFTWLANRKAYARKENASAKDAELSVHEKQIERYEQRLAQRDAKVDVIYTEFRKSQEHVLELKAQINKLEFEVELRELQKCEKRGCPDRKPPGVY